MLGEETGDNKQSSQNLEKEKETLKIPILYLLQRSNYRCTLISLVVHGG
jgi:hypothetical protein